MKRCPNCGKELKADATFCPKCGTNVSNVDSQERTPSAKRPTHKSHKGLVVAIVLLILISAGGGAYAYQKLFANNEQTSSNKNSSASSSQSSSSSLSSDSNTGSSSDKSSDSNDGTDGSTVTKSEAYDLLSGTFEDISDSVASGEIEDFDSSFVNGSNNKSYPQFKNWLKKEFKNQSVASVAASVHNLSLSGNQATFYVRYNFTISNGGFGSSTYHNNQLFKWVAQLKKVDNQWLILSCTSNNKIIKQWKSDN